MSETAVHSLWAVVLVSVWAAAAWSRAAQVRGNSRRLARLLDADGGRTPSRRTPVAGRGNHPKSGGAGESDRPSAGGWRAGPARWKRWAGRAGALRDRWPAVGAGLAVVALVGGVPGCVAGLVAGYGVRRWARARPSRRPEGAGVGTDGLPLAADLLAACLAAGAGPREAAEAVGGSLGGPLGERLARTAAELRLGGEPAAAWGRLAELPGAHRLARCLERAQATGVPAVESVGRLATECRAERARATIAAARRAGVLATAPLGLCFLPAFLAVGVAPVLIGLASRLVNGGA